MSEAGEVIYVCYERGGGWYVGWSRRWSERLELFPLSHQALAFARQELGSGLVRHYDVNGFLQGEERVSRRQITGLGLRLRPSALAA